MRAHYGVHAFVQERGLVRTATGGFTIVELVATIVILGILSAVALPKFQNLSTSARSASCLAWKSTLEGGSAINFGARVAVATAGSALTTCTSAALGGIVAGGLPAAGSGNAVSVAGTFSAGAVTNGTTGSCSIEYSAAGGACTATVTLIGIN